jgi:hypothetical protein
MCPRLLLQPQLTHGCSGIMHLAAQVRAQIHQLGPVTDRLAQPPGGRRRDPRLGQPAQAQQIGQVGGVPFRRS